MAKAGSSKPKKKARRDIPETGRAVVTSSFNNTIITISDPSGNTLCWGTCGKAGFKGSRKSTPYAATVAATGVAERALALGVKRVSVFIKGPGSGRDAAVKALRAAGLQITSLADITPIPHNGCRPKKRRRG